MMGHPMGWDCLGFDAWWRLTRIRQAQLSGAVREARHLAQPPQSLAFKLGLGPHAGKTTKPTVETTVHDPNLVVV